MNQTIFFSWQSDTPSRVSRSFIKDVLEDVCKDIVSDASVNEAVRGVEVDSDTQGMAGQPPIVETILKKIDAASVFIADMTFIGTRVDGRATPNPNVLIEYGWALKGLGYNRIICLMNAAYGEPTNSSLPFDLSHVRWPICYNLPDNASPKVKEKERKKLTEILNKAVRASLATIPLSQVEVSSEFPAAKAKDGPARFRNPGESLGFEDDFGWSESNKEMFLSTGPTLWLRLMPITKPAKEWPAHELKKIAMEGSSSLLPFLNGAGGYSYLRAEDGIGMFRAVPKNDQNINSIAFAFVTGEVWSVDTAWLEFNSTALPFIEDCYIEGIKRYKQFLQSLGIQPPFRWIAGISGIKGRHLQYPSKPGYSHVGLGPICSADLIEVEGRYDEGQDATAALLPFFEKVFEKCGLPRPDYLPQ